MGTMEIDYEEDVQEMLDERAELGFELMEKREHFNGRDGGLPGLKRDF